MENLRSKIILALPQLSQHAVRKSKKINRQETKPPARLMNRAGGKCIRLF
jgi:hypothetical protein